MATFNNGKNNVSSETLKYWVEQSNEILKAEELGLLDFSDPFMKGRLEWAKNVRRRKNTLLFGTIPNYRPMASGNGRNGRIKGAEAPFT